MGPIATRRQLDRIESWSPLDEQEGAGSPPDGRPARASDRGVLHRADGVRRVHNHSTIAREEIFGPVLSIIPAERDAAVIEIANDTPYGLEQLGVHPGSGPGLCRGPALRSGTVGHNAFRSDFGIAFGGFKQSGIGREGGVEGLLPFLETKTIILDGAPSHLNA